MNSTNEVISNEIISTLSVDIRLLKLMGEKLYSGHPLWIVTRELLQNSRDACITSNSPDSHIKITLEINPDYYIIICEDNGIGMSSEDILNKFLCLGRSGKDNGDSVGGFGIAKAAILSCDEWVIESRDNYLDDSMLGYSPIKKIEYRQGTKITVRLNKDNSWYENTNITRAIGVVLLSEIGVDTTLQVIDNHSDNSHIYSCNNGFINGLKHKHEGDYWKMYLINLEDHSELYNPFINKDIFRLNGLVQYIENVYSDRKTTIVTDFTITNDMNIRPEDKLYPFSMSRESITSRYNGDVYKHIRYYNENASTAKIESRQTEDNIYLEEGGFNYGEVIMGSGSIDIQDLIDGNIEFKIVENGDKNRGRPNKISTLVINGDKSKITEYCNLLNLWRSILELTTINGDHWGIGLIMDNNILAQRRYYNGKDYYIINPCTIEGITDVKILIHRIFYLACHESLHYSYDSHNENFTSALDFLLSLCIGKILGDFTRIRRLANKLLE